MLAAPPPGYNAAAVNRQSVQGSSIPGAQGVPVQGGTRLWPGVKEFTPGGAPWQGQGGAGLGSFAIAPSSQGPSQAPAAPVPDRAITQQVARGPMAAGNMQQILRQLTKRGTF